MNAVKTNRAVLRPAAAGTLAAAVLVLSGAVSAGAAPQAPAPTPSAAAPVAPPALAAAQIAAARDAAGSGATLGVLERFFAHDPDRGTGAAPALTAGGKGAAPRLTGAAVPVYTLNADFVAGRAGAPVAVPAFVATEAVSATGQHASVWSARTAHGWQVVNIASGADETTYAAKAQGHGIVFREPQINAWYLLRGDHLAPLNGEARAAIGAHGTTVAGYRAHVRFAYGSRLAGSAYDHSGYAGGFGKESARAAAGPAARPASTTVKTAADQPSGTDTGTLTGLAGAGAALTLAAALAGRRRLLRSRGAR